jgi:membrane associated rhomboid family serine protease
LRKTKAVFPLKTLRRSASTPYVTYSLIALNALVFLWQLTLTPGELGRVFYTMALVPCEATRDPLAVETALDMLRTMFLHGGWVHLIANMVFLSVFGPNIEDYLGKARYLAFYLLAGFVASITHTVINWNVCIPTIGASGAIYGLLGAFFLLYPATRVRTVAFFYRIPVGLVDVQAFYMLLYYFVIDFFNGIASLGVDNAATGGVAVWAHIGGFLAGLLMAFIMMLFKPPPPVDPLEHVGT